MKDFPMGCVPTHPGGGDCCPCNHARVQRTCVSRAPSPPILCVIGGQNRPYWSPRRCSTGQTLDSPLKTLNKLNLCTLMMRVVEGCEGWCLLVTTSPLKLSVVDWLAATLDTNRGKCWKALTSLPRWYRWISCQGMYKNPTDRTRTLWGFAFHQHSHTIRHPASSMAHTVPPRP